MTEAILNNKGKINAINRIDIHALGTLDNTEGQIVTEQEGMLEIREDVRNRSGWIHANKGSFRVRSLAGKIRTTCGGRISAQLAKVTISATQVFTDESSLVHGKCATYIAGWNGVRQQSIIFSKEVLFYSKRDLDLDAGIFSGNELSIIVSEAQKKLMLTKEVISKGLLMVIASHIRSTNRLLARNMDFTAHTLSLMGITKAIEDIEATLREPYDFVDGGMTADRTLRFNLPQGFDLRRPLRNTGSIHINVPPSATRAINILADITTGYTPTALDKVRNPSMIPIVGGVHIDAPGAPMTVGTPGVTYVSVGGSGKTTLVTSAFDLAYGRVLGHQGVDVTASSTLVIGRMSSPRVCGLLSGDALTLTSRSSYMEFVNADIYSRGKLICNSPVQVDSLSSTLQVDDDADINTPRFINRLTRNIKNSPFLIPNSGGAYYQNIQVTSNPNSVVVRGTLKVTGQVHSIGSQLHMKQFIGICPLLETIVEYTYVNNPYQVEGERRPWYKFGHRWHKGGHRPKKWVDKISTVPNSRVFQAILSEATGILLQNKMITIMGVVSSPMIEASGFEICQVGLKNLVVRIKVKPFIQMIALANYMRPSARYEFASDPASETVIRSIIPSSFGLRLPPKTVLHRDGRLISFTEAGVFGSLMPPEYEAEKLVLALMDNIGRGYLSPDITNPDMMLVYLMMNAEEYRMGGGGTPGFDTEGNPLWAAVITKPLLIYRISDFEGKPRLSPHLMLPLSWNNLSFSSRMGALISSSTIRVIGLSDKNSVFSVTGRLDSKGVTTIGNLLESRFETQSMTKKETFYEERSQSFLGIGSSKVHKREVTTIEHQAAAGVTAAGVVMENIANVHLAGAEFGIGEAGFTATEKIGSVTEKAVVDVTVTLHKSSASKHGVKSSSTTCVTTHVFKPTVISSLGPIAMVAETQDLSSLRATTPSDMTLGTTKGSLILGSTKATDDLSPRHSVKGLVSSTTTGTQEVGTTVHLAAGGTATLFSASSIEGVAPTVVARKAIVKAVKGVTMDVLTLNTHVTTKSKGFYGLSFSKKKIEEHHESGKVPTMVGTEGILIQSIEDSVVLIAPVLFSGDELRISAPKGNIVIKSASFHHDISVKELSASLNFFGSQAVEAAMRKDFAKAAHSLLREFPLLASMGDLMRSKDAADKMANGMKTLYNLYKTYKAFAEAASLSEFLAGQISISPKLRLGKSVTEEHYVEAALPWLQARHIIMTSVNILGEGIQATCEDLSLLADKVIDLNAAEEVARSRTRSGGVSVGYNFSSSTPTVGVDYASSESRALEYLTSRFSVSNLSTLVAGDISLKGVCIETLKAVLDAENLHLETLQDRVHSSHRSTSASSEGSVSGSTGRHDRVYAKEQAGIIAQATLVANIRKHIELVGAKIIVGEAAKPITAFHPSGTTESFYEHTMPGHYNDCGYFSLGVPRAMAAQQLLDNSKKVEFRSLVAPEIHSAILTDHLPEAMMTFDLETLKIQNWTAQDAIDKEMIRLKERYPSLPKVSAELLLPHLDFSERDSLRKKLETLEAANKAFLDYLQQESTYVAYIRHYVQVPGNPLVYIGAQGGIHPTSSMDAIAKVNNLNVRVWVRVREGDPLTVIHSYESKPGNRWINLFHTNGLSHYNLLTSSPALVAAPSIAARDLVDSDRSKSTSLGVDLSGSMPTALSASSGAAPPVKGTFDIDHHAAHKERVNRATLSGGVTVAGGMDASGINRDRARAQEETVNKKHHYRAFGLLGDTKELYESMMVLFSKPPRMFVSSGSAVKPVDGLEVVKEKSPDKEKAKAKAKVLEKPAKKLSPTEQHRRRIYNEAVVGSIVEKATKRLTAQGHHISEERLKQMAKKQADEFLRGSPKKVQQNLARHGGYRGGSDGPDGFKESLHRGTDSIATSIMNFFISPAGADERRKDDRGRGWDDPRIRKLASSRLTDLLDPELGPGKGKSRPRIRNRVPAGTQKADVVRTPFSERTLHSSRLAFQPTFAKYCLENRDVPKTGLNLTVDDFLRRDKVLYQSDSRVSQQKTDFSVKKSSRPVELLFSSGHRLDRTHSEMVDDIFHGRLNVMEGVKVSVDLEGGWTPQSFKMKPSEHSARYDRGRHTDLKSGQFVMSPWKRAKQDTKHGIKNTTSATIEGSSSKGNVLTKDYGRHCMTDHVCVGPKFYYATASSKSGVKHDKNGFFAFANTAIKAGLNLFSGTIKSERFGFKVRADIDGPTLETEVGARVILPSDIGVQGSLDDGIYALLASANIAVEEDACVYNYCMRLNVGGMAGVGMGAKLSAGYASYINKFGGTMYLKTGFFNGFGLAGEANVTLYKKLEEETYINPTEMSNKRRP